MVLESLINPFSAEKRPWELFLIGIFYSSIGMALALWVFAEYASVVMVFFTVLAIVPFFMAILLSEETKDLNPVSEQSLLKEHSKTLTFLAILFLGMILSFTLWYLLSPASIQQSLFEAQIATISHVSSNDSSDTLGSSFALFVEILVNNLKVMLLCLIFSLLYGVGAIFILTWNASVISAAIGQFIQLQISNNATYLHAASLGLARFMVHGVPEIIAYFVAALAGGIISVAIVQKHYKSEGFSKILLDSSDLIIIAIIFLMVGALFEVYLTPVFF